MTPRSLFDMAIEGGIDPMGMSGVPALSASSHDGASDDKMFRRWIPGKLSADADILPELGTLVSRSRDLQRNSPTISGAHQTLLDNVIGTGLRLQSLPDYRVLGKTKEWADEWAENTEAHWRTFADSKYCDAAESLNFHGLTSLVFRSGALNGEALALPVWIQGTRSKWNTRFHLVESDQLSNPNGLPDTDRLRGGIESDVWGRALAYHIRTTHPGDFVGFSMPLSGKWDRIPAETDWGRQRVLHVHDKERSGQSRGKPWYSAVIKPSKMLDQYMTAENKAAIASALIAAFIETPLDPAQLTETLGGGNVSSAEYQDFLGTIQQYVAPLDGGAIIPLPPGSHPIPFNPSRPGQQLDSFITAMDRRIAAGLNMPYELYLKDFSKTKYSSARAALIEAWRFFKSRRQWIANCWANPAYNLWLEEAVNAGVIEAPDFYRNIQAYSRCGWIGAGRGWVDPVKEAQASKMRMDGNVSTLAIECAEQGLDWREVLEQRKTERDYMKRLGLTGDMEDAIDPMAPDLPEQVAA